ncbi:aspartate carbamoyltransferase [Lactiplantibacillus sp. WILCCON 0030]|uniref:Aspartate carbamoyltransferase n=1 Tax=Lactiplantibacillus brownii TaxID=3069269 RepID=A0ABU1AAC7_9LACO|nr:aspartate carbamoyltransferase [Lactiplantibacillus brownii]MDQ7937928.1 aspartate carbamoyltransferase [Lactiplantibacillus brownii]
MQHFITNDDLSLEITTAVIQRAHAMAQSPADFQNLARHQQLATLFFEPSTRTRLSFTSAMHSLGGTVLGFESSSSTSTAKGESLIDTIRVVSQYVDIIALRHPQAGAAQLAAKYASVPVINAGDGAHLHPTQTLADLTTIDHYKHRLNHLTIAFAGDLKYGRTVHSLVQALMRYGQNRFIFVSHPTLKIPVTLRAQLVAKNIAFEEVTNFAAINVPLDALYMTRVQAERFATPAAYDEVKDAIQLTPAQRNLLTPETLLLHPLPRGHELPTTFDTWPQAHYFDQVKAGRFVRMALIETLLAQNH